MEDRGARKVCEYDCSANGAWWTVSFGLLGPIAGMSGGWRNGSEGDSPTAFRTGAALRGAAVPDRQIPDETVKNAPPCADMV